MYALGVEDATEESADNDLSRRDLHGGQVGQVVSESPLFLRSGVGRQHGVGIGKGTRTTVCTILQQHTTDMSLGARLRHTQR